MTLTSKDNWAKKHKFITQVKKNLKNRFFKVYLRLKNPWSVLEVINVIVWSLVVTSVIITSNDFKFSSSLSSLDDVEDEDEDEEEDEEDDEDEVAGVGDLAASFLGVGVRRVAFVDLTTCNARLRIWVDFLSRTLFGGLPRGLPLPRGVSDFSLSRSVDGDLCLLP